MTSKRHGSLPRATRRGILAALKWGRSPQSALPRVVLAERSFGPHAEVLDPPELRKQIARTLALALETYEQKQERETCAPPAQRNKSRAEPDGTRSPSVMSLPANQMRPRLFGRGRWRGATRAAADDAASMWPRLVSRGRDEGPCAAGSVVLASMGPRLKSRGKLGIK
jgi:hypothetical protein